MTEDVPTTFQIRQEERKDIKARGPIIEGLARKYLAETPLTQERPWEEKDIEKIKQFFLESAPHSHPKLYPSYWEHIILTGLYARNLAREMNIPGYDPLQAQVLGLIHDIGRLLVPHRYYRNDIAAGLLLKDIGIRPEVMAKEHPVARVLGRGTRVKSIEDITEPQRVIDIADNLGRRTQEGVLFTADDIESYSSGQPERYKNTVFPSETWAIHQLAESGKQKLGEELIEAEINWMRESGVDVERIRAEVTASFNSPQNQDFLSALKNAQSSGTTL